MKARELIRRKAREGWSDLQLLILLTVAEEQLVAFAELVRHTGGSEPGVWNTIQKLIDREALETFDIEGKTYYLLSAAGSRSVRKILEK